MQILFVDESGTPPPPEKQGITQYFVIGGVVVPEDTKENISMTTLYLSSQNPPQSPFFKGGLAFPPLWQRGVRGDFENLCLLTNELISIWAKLAADLKRLKEHPLEKAGHRVGFIFGAIGTIAAIWTLYN